MFFKGCRSDSSGDSAPCLLFTLPISEKKRRAGPAAGPRRMRHSLCSKGMKYFTILQEFSFRAEKKRNRTGAVGVCAAKREGAGGRGAGDAERLRVAGVLGNRVVREQGGSRCREAAGADVAEKAEGCLKYRIGAAALPFQPGDRFGHGEPLPGLFRRETASDTVNRCPAVSAGRTPQMQRNRFPTVSPGEVAEWGSYSRSGPR